MARSVPRSRTGSSSIGLLRQPGAGEAHEHAALVDPGRQAARSAAASSVADVGQHDDRALGSASASSTSPWRISAKGASARSTIVEVAEQRLAALASRLADQMPTGRRRQPSSSSTAAPAELWPSTIQARDPVAQLGRQHACDALAVALAGGERHRPRGRPAGRRRRWRARRRSRGAPPAGRASLQLECARLDAAAATAAAAGRRAQVAHDRELTERCSRSARARPASSLRVTMPSLSQTLLSRRRPAEAGRALSARRRDRSARAAA